MTNQGVIDRIENGIATILIGEDTELNVDTVELPDGADEGVWLNVEADTGELISVEINEERTKKRSEENKELLEELRQKSGTSSEHEKVE